MPSRGPRDESGRLGAGADPDVWEVFRQEKDGDPMRHAGNVRAPDRELAMHYAREFYSRRNESVRLWVVPRTEITDLTDPDLLQPPLDRSFKKPGGYVMRDKLEVAKKRAARRAPVNARLTRGGPTAHAAADPAGPARVRRVRARPGAARRDRRPAADDGRRRVRHRLPRLGVDRHRADARGGRRVLVDRAGRDRARAPALRDARGADRRGCRPTRVPPPARPSTATPACSTSPRQGWAFTIARRWLYDTADSVRLAALAQSSFAPLAEVVAKIRREERYHLMHLDAWLERLANARTASRATKLPTALEALEPIATSVFAPLPGEEMLVAAGCAVGTHGRSRRSLAVGGQRPTVALLGPAHRSRMVGRRRMVGSRAQPDESFVWLWNEFTSVARLEEGAEW